MDRKTIVLGLLAVGMMALAVALLVRQWSDGVGALSGMEAPEPDPPALFVCDHCGAEATLPLDNTSPDCPDCAQGQMVQRVFFRCKTCGEVFEAYQICWSPDAGRAAAKVEQADKAFADAECGGEARLVRRPGGSWLWAYCGGKDDPGSQVVDKLLCPKCGETRRGQFVKMLVPPAS